MEIELRDVFSVHRYNIARPEDGNGEEIDARKVLRVGSISNGSGRFSQCVRK